MILLSEKSSKLAFWGIYFRMSLFAFSIAPFCQEQYESAKYTLPLSRPPRLSIRVISRCAANSQPLSVGVVVAPYFAQYCGRGHFCFNVCGDACFFCRWIWRRKGVGRVAWTGENDYMHRQRAAIIKKTFKKRQSIFLLRWEMLILQTVRTRKNLWIYLL